VRVEFINPFVTATQNVFHMMLGQTLRRGPLSLKHEHSPMYDVSGLIGLSGKCRGMIVVSLSRGTAMSAAEIMLGNRPEEINGDVMDAIGELTNMIAGAAKTQLEEYRLTIGLPTVICGKGQAVAFPSQASPMVIPFDSDLGPVCIQVGIVEGPTE
jgi:chemotaxis protein CheX